METNNIKLSIIIPYFETYELTEKLLKELSIQNNDNIEILLIDDGCNEKRLDSFKYLNCIDNLQIIHKENGGVSTARNKGLEIAKGKYIAFVDSDDMIMPNYIEDLLELINTKNEDIIYFNWLDINTNSLIRHPNNPAVWKAIYKKEILPKFDETLKAREDYFFNVELENNNYSKFYYDKVLYIYNSGRENSLTWKNERGIL